MLHQKQGRANPFLVGKSRKPISLEREQVKIPFLQSSGFEGEKYLFYFPLPLTD